MLIFVIMQAEKKNKVIQNLSPKPNVKTNDENLSRTAREIENTILT